MGPKLGWLTLEYDKPGARAYVWSDQRCRHHGGLRTFVRGKMVRPAHGSVGDMRRRASDRWAGLVGSRSADLILRRTAVDCDRGTKIILAALECWRRGASWLASEEMRASLPFLRAPERTA